MRCASLAIAGALILLPGRGHAAETTPGVWRKSCEAPKDGPPRCVAEQIAVSEPGDRPALRVTFEVLPDHQAKLTALVPLGVSLRAGLDLAVDAAAPIKLPFERCTPGGCEVSAVLDQTALEKFVKGATLRIGYAPADNLSASVPLKLDGLAAILKTVSK